MRTALLAAAFMILPAAPVSAASLDDAIAGKHRSAENRSRDVYRHPRETLEFFGFSPDQTVVELWPGGGWYTEILAPALRDNGNLVLAVFGEAEPDSYRTRSHRSFVTKIESDPEIYGNATMVNFWPPESDSLGPPGSADLVVTFRNVHSMYRRDQFETFLAAAHAVLKPGGTLGIVQHRAEPGSDPEDAKRSGYLPEQWVIDQATAAGFKLAGRSEINANPKDTKDHPDGVWSLPPGFGSGDQDREKFAAIGESDRMTLRFSRP
jgi:predicted methyltransferase